MKWIARLGEREETVEIRSRRPQQGEGDVGPETAAGNAADLVTVRVGDEVLELDVGAGLALRGGEISAPGTSPAGSTPAREASVIHAGRQHEVAIDRLSRSRYVVSIDGRRYEVTVDDQLGFLTREAAEARGGASGTVTAYMPGKVAAVLVEEGAEVTAGEGVVVLEAMKMENEIQAEVDGVVSRIYVESGQAVEGGDPLFEVTVNE